MTGSLWIKILMGTTCSAALMCNDISEDTK